jgi:hypothetical protein
MNFTTFDQASPPESGWYWVKWEKDYKPIKVWLQKVPTEPQDEPPAHDVETWVWGWNPADDPESICEGISNPTQIEWSAA